MERKLETIKNHFSLDQLKMIVKIQIKAIKMLQAVEPGKINRIIINHTSREHQRRKEENH